MYLFQKQTTFSKFQATSMPAGPEESENLKNQKLSRHQPHRNAHTPLQQMHPRISDHPSSLEKEISKPIWQELEIIISLSMLGMNNEPGTNSVIHHVLTLMWQAPYITKSDNYKENCLQNKRLQRKKATDLKLTWARTCVGCASLFITSVPVRSLLITRRLHKIFCLLIISKNKRNINPQKSLHSISLPNILGPVPKVFLELFHLDP